MKSFSILAGNKINREMISEAIQLDRLSYDDVYQLQVDTCFDYFEKNNDIYIMAVDNESGRVIGYINYSPIKEEVYSELSSGSVIDTVITGDDVLPYEDGACYWGYFSSIVVHPDYRQHGIATQMLLYWSDLVSLLATKRSIYFKGIVVLEDILRTNDILREAAEAYMCCSLARSLVVKRALFRATVLFPLGLLFYSFMESVAFCIPEINLFLNTALSRFLIAMTTVIWLCCSPFRKSCCNGTWTEMLFNLVPVEFILMLCFAQWRFTVSIVLTLFLVLCEIVLFYKLRKDECSRKFTKKRHRMYKVIFQRCTVLALSIYLCCSEPISNTRIWTSISFLPSRTGDLEHVVC